MTSHQLRGSGQPGGPAPGHRWTCTRPAVRAMMVGWRAPSSRHAGRRRRWSLLRLPSRPAGALRRRQLRLRLDRRRAAPAHRLAGGRHRRSSVWFGALSRLGRLGRAWSSPSPAGSGCSGWPSWAAGPATLVDEALERGPRRTPSRSRRSRPRRPGAAGGGWSPGRPVPSRAAVRVTRNIDYWGDGEPASPARRLPVAPWRRPRSAPVLVYIHGGAWVIGDKREQGIPMMHELVPGLGVRRRQLPAEPARPRGPTTSSTASGPWPGSAAHRRVRRATRAFIAGPVDRPAATSPRSWPSPPATRSGSPDSRTPDTSVDACVPFYGVYDMTGSPEGSAAYGPGMRRPAREDGS